MRQGVITAPRLLVLSSLFPSDVQPVAGIFIRERMFRVARRLPITVVAPQPWSPADELIRRFVLPHYRPHSQRAHETVDGIEIHRPNYFSLPSALKRLDGAAMARAIWPLVERLHRDRPFQVVDAHFAYPDGYAAVQIARRLALPAVVTLRGTKDSRLIGTALEPLLRATLRDARMVIAVSDALMQLARELGVPRERVRMIGNGVDLTRFAPVERGQARRALGLPDDAKVLISVGGLAPNKGFQRVIQALPKLLAHEPALFFLIVGGGTSVADMSAGLERQARALGVAERVRLCGRQLPDQLKQFYGAADLFVLATEYEGWANVLLEAMACGLPVVTTRVGGNPQVVANEALGTLVDYWDEQQFVVAVDQALRRRWDRQVIIDYARSNGWERRIDELVDLFQAVAPEPEPWTSRVPAMTS